MIILSIYINKVYRELRLPVINDSDYSLVLYSNVFEIKTDLKLELEVIDNAWSIKGTNYYCVLKDGYRYDDYLLHSSDMFQLYTENGETLTIVVREVAYPFAVFDKYDLRECSQITIGKRDDMDICYDYLGLVSREHTILYRTNTGWAVCDKSQNGIYINSQLVSGEKNLEFGDHVSIIGLNLVFLGDILAIDNSQGNVLINTNVLKPYVYHSLEQTEDEEILFKDS